MEEYQQNLVHYFGLQDLAPEEQKQVVEEITEVLEIRVFNKAYDALSPEDRELMDGLVEEGDPEKVMTLLQEKVPDLNTYFQEQLAEMKKELDAQMEELLANAQKQAEAKLAEEEKEEE